MDLLYSYFKRVSDSKISPVDHDSDELLNAHNHHSCLVFDKNFDSVFPDVQLEYVLESQGIFDYSAYLVDGKEYSHHVCKDNSELFFPNVTGDHWNPYIRYTSSSKCGIQQSTKLQDLVGINHINLEDPALHESVFNDIVLSYPLEIDRLFLDEKYRSRSNNRITKSGSISDKKKITKYNLIDRMNRCFSKFFKDLHVLLNIDKSHVLGCSDRLHLWSSDLPFMPNVHHHLILPHFTYKRISNDDREFINDLVLDPLVKEYSDCVATIESGGNKMNVDYDSGVEGINIQSSKIEKNVHRYIVDQDRYDEFRLTLSNKLIPLVGYDPLPWFGLIKKEKSLSGVEVPLNVDDIRELWSNCVFNEFFDILGDRGSKVLDVYVSFIPHHNRKKLLHALQYHTRPAVVDLDKFFKKCSGVVLDHNSLDLSMIEHYLKDKIQLFSKKQNELKLIKFESMLSKFLDLKNQYSDCDFYSWVQFLSVWNTQTKVRGFWRNIKRYMLDPDHVFLIDEVICPICGGSLDHVRYVSDPVIDYVIIRNKTNFTIYSVDGG